MKTTGNALTDALNEYLEGENMNKDEIKSMEEGERDVLALEERARENERERKVNILRHSLRVAEKMVTVAGDPLREKAEKEEGILSLFTPKETEVLYFLTGLLHDIGKLWNDYNEKKLSHALLGKEMLKNVFKEHSYVSVAKVIALHGTPINRVDCSILNRGEKDLLDVLNVADLTTLPNGEDCTPEERLEDVVKRYGEHSREALDMKDLIDCYSNASERCVTNASERCVTKRGV